MGQRVPDARGNYHHHDVGVSHTHSLANEHHNRHCIADVDHNGPLYQMERLTFSVFCLLHLPGFAYPQNLSHNPTFLCRKDPNLRGNLPDNLALAGEHVHMYLLTENESGPLEDTAAR